ncbi:DEAD/DEAH box helicase [Bacillus sp. ISL-40]|uniref:DEAD/DEAH box helicase n=1 Tax=Bacillus sp. ISL-40 TaxID=2819126 RepID=UPI001BEC8D7F|nr:DEAD/DEAH box helicase [Bacillus sp. ISL-40]MBT2697248.1 DEAD/DEAH box helicase [Bacillus sp. ISL-40]
MSLFSQKMKQFTKETQDVIVNPIDLFYNELVQQKQHDFLRDNQTAFLNTWHNRRDERDIVGVMNTGAGKTLIGLLMLYSKLKEDIGPAVYLCPDTQLVEQVCNQATLYGIPTCKVISRGEKRQEFPLDFLNSKSVLVTTFEKLFNGKSIFGVKGSVSREIQNIGALLIDDAHECIKKARGKASIKMNKSTQSELYEKFLSLFDDDIKTQGLGAYNSIKRGEKSIIKQIPFWAWKNKLDVVVKLLEENNDASNIFFNYDLLIDELELSECFISGDSIEITPLLIPTYKIPSLENAKHRFILSATLNNSYELVSEMGIEKAAIESPIKIDNVNLGERLILAPKRYHGDVENDDIRSICVQYAKKYNVVVIVPNKKRAEIWTKLGAIVLDSENILSELKVLKEDIPGKLIVLINRYDGMDLIDEMCRIIVLDGMPTKETLKAKIETQYRENSLYVNTKKAQSIEQGLGRAVRSGTDHCVAILMGDDLLKFIGINTNKKLFSPVVQAQLEFGFSLVEGVELLDKTKALAAIVEGIEYCLGASEEWRHFHKQLTNEAFKKYQTIDFTKLVNLSDFERKAQKAAKNRDIVSVDKNMQGIMNEISEIDKGWYTQLYAHLLSNLNQQRATDLQVQAYNLQNSLIKPLTPTKGKVVKKLGNQIASFKSNLLKFDRGTDICIEVESIISSLIYSPDMHYKKFEKAVDDLGKFLGFVTSQPDNETDDGPDNFWGGELKDFVIECKNNSLNNISRDETNQMFASIRWYSRMYKDETRMMPIMLHRSSYSESNSHANGAFRVIEDEKLVELKNNLREWSKALSQKAPDSWTDKELESLLNQFSFTENKIVDYYTRLVKE